VSTALVPDPAIQPTMKVELAAKALGISRGAAYLAVEHGDLPAIRIGKRIVIPTAAVRRMLLLDGGPDAG
jgi:excisionase family DNA binding protein